MTGKKSGGHHASYECIEIGFVFRRRDRHPQRGRAAGAQVVDSQETTPPATTPSGAATPTDDATIAGDAADTASQPIVVTGSRIRRDPNDSSLPLQIVTTAELERNAISNPEQFISFLTTNGTGSDNLASNSDVVSGQQRGNNGASFANLRGQGSAATLVLLNGRRVASHGLNGAAVDVNQIPFGAIERIEVLKDGASAIYGTDAIGGVINFITRKDYTGIGLSAFSDITDEGDAPIYRLSGIAGYGDLDSNGFNIMAAVSYSDIAELRGSAAASSILSSPSVGFRPIRAAVRPAPSSRSASARTRRWARSSPATQRRLSSRHQYPRQRRHQRA
jgi:outer membrane receptor protein involved in Fe transport